MSKHLVGLGLFLAMVMPTAAQPQAPSAQHKITVKFDYDFRKTPACTTTVKTNCVQQFIVYDISGGVDKRIKLFSIPVPIGAKGALTGITGTSPQLVFETGKHYLGVAAQMPSGSESKAGACQTSVQINP